MPGTSFLYTRRWAQAEQGSLIRSRPSSSRRVVSATLYQTEVCSSVASTWAEQRPWPPSQGEATVSGNDCASIPRRSRKNPPSDREQIPSFSSFTCSLLQELSVAHLFSLSGALGPFAEPPQSSIVLGGKQLVNLKRGIDIGWLFSFTEKF